MDIQIEPSSNRKRVSNPLYVFAILILFTFVVTLFLLWHFYYPNNQHIAADVHDMKKPVFYQGNLTETTAIGEKESLKLPFSLAKEVIDPTLVYEESSDSVIITSQDKVVRLRTTQLTGLVNEKPFNLKFPVEKSGGKVYLPIEPLQQFYQIQLRESEQTGAVILVKEGDILQWGKVLGQPNKTVPMRSGNSIKQPIISDIPSDEKVMIWGEENGWYKVQQTNGYIGYVAKTAVAFDHVESIPRQELSKVFVPWKPLGGKINLTWEQITTTKNPDTSKISAMPGLNIVSPTWFQLGDGEGNLRNIADPAYVKWAHSHNYQVWALFSNSFEPKRTTEALSTYDRRMKMIKQLLSFAQMYQLQGINIDFENVNTKDKENLVQFVREMTPLLHEQGLVVSIDVTAKSKSEMWSLFYDRQALSQTVDYMMLMAYDEYWAASPVAGSVASLPWVEKSIATLLKEDQVPPSKLVLGVPFYTRIWTEETKEGKTNVTSKAIFMDTVQKLMKDKTLTPAISPETGQNYVEFKDGDKLNKIWLEDETSVKARMDLVKKYDLAGVASWRRGYESPDTWKWIQDTLEKRP